MSKQHDQQRREAEHALDQFRETEEGKSQYWGTLLDYCRGDSMIALLESTLHLSGDVIECGVYRGASLRKICRAVSDFSPDKLVFACDSFSGFPAEQVGRVDLGFLRFRHRVKKKFQLCDDVPERMERFFQMHRIHGQIVKGNFSETLKQFEHEKFCFIHLDCDLYESYKECLGELFHCLVPGGVVVFHDYGSPNWPGAKKAVDGFFATKAETPQQSRQRDESAWYVRRSAEAE
jgi:SAM-dependent methyltransferase